MEYHAFFRLKRRDYAASKPSLPPTAPSTQLTRGLVFTLEFVFVCLLGRKFFLLETLRDSVNIIQFMIACSRWKKTLHFGESHEHLMTQTLQDPW